MLMLGWPVHRLEDEAAAELAELIGDVGTEWLPGNDLANEYARMQQEGTLFHL
eukprot:COSAG02_NODE_32721_length_511_cov_2.038835_1_plen_53_part_00